VPLSNLERDETSDSEERTSDRRAQGNSVSENRHTTELDAAEPTSSIGVMVRYIDAS
jgi:hypothetical protein